MFKQELTSFNVSDTSAGVILLPLQKLKGQSSLEPRDIVGTAVWDRNLLDALGSTLTQRHAETGAYRLRGEDSLTWGDQRDWSKLNIIRSLFSQQRPLTLETYFDLETIVRQTDSLVLADYFDLRNAEAVNAYIAQHPELGDFLQESHRLLRRFFGAEPGFVLEVVRDPETPAPSDLLFVNIRTAMPVDEAMARLDQFDENWYLDQVDSYGDLVNFNLEFYDL
jgi:hypothetical protein